MFLVVSPAKAGVYMWDGLALGKIVSHAKLVT
jgi:hypothetical protein